LKRRLPALPLEDQGVGRDLADGLDLDRQLVVLLQLHELVDAVVAGSRDDLGAGSFNLVRLDLSRFDPALGEIGHGQLTTASPAAVVFLAVGVHLDKMKDRMPNDLALFLDDAAQPDQVAGIVERYGFWIL